MYQVVKMNNSERCQINENYVLEITWYGDIDIVIKVHTTFEADVKNYPSIYILINKMVFIRLKYKQVL